MNLNELLLEELSPVIDQIQTEHGGSLATICVLIHKYYPGEPATVAWSVYHTETGHCHGATLHAALNLQSIHNPLAAAIKHLAEAQISFEEAQRQVEELKVLTADEPIHR